MLKLYHLEQYFQIFYLYKNLFQYKIELQSTDRIRINDLLLILIQFKLSLI